MAQPRIIRSRATRILAALFVVLAASLAPSAFLTGAAVSQARTTHQVISGDDAKGTGPTSPQGATECPPPAWTVVTSPNSGEGNNVLNDVSAVSENDVWAVGNYTDTNNLRRTLTMHWNGSSWSIIPSPSPLNYSSLEAVSARASNDVWAVGWSRDNESPTESQIAQPLVLHWDGSSWSELTGLPLPDGYETGQLGAVVAIAPGDVWAAGNFSATDPQGASYSSPFLMHWNGTAWTARSTGDRFSSLRMYDITASSTNDVWAVGHPGLYYSGVVLHWNGQEWTSTSAEQLNGIDALSPTDVWAVGRATTRSPNGAFYPATRHWDGTSWRSVFPGEPYNDWNVFSDVEVIGHNDVWAVGHYAKGTSSWTPGGGPYPQLSMIQHWNGARWNYIPTAGEIEDSFLTGIAAASAGNIWAVGSANHKTLIMRYAPTFPDVAPDAAFYEYIERLACEGVIGGYPDGTFRSNNPVTRGQIAKIVSNSEGYGEEPTRQTFADVPPGSPFYPYVERIASRSIVGGYPCGARGEPCDGQNRPYFRPGHNMSRGQMAKVVANARGYDDPIPPEYQTFLDVPPSHTFWLYIERIAQHNVMTGYRSGGPCIGPCFQPEADVTRGQTTKVAVNAFFLDDRSDTCASPPPLSSGNIATDRHCGPAGTTFKIAAGGFERGESIEVYMTAPGGGVYPVNTTGDEEVDGDGIVGPLTVHTNADMRPGIWKVTAEGTTSHHAVSTYFKLARPEATQGGPCQGIPASENMTVGPSNCAPTGSEFEFTGAGFEPGEYVGIYLTAPDGSVLGFSSSIEADERGSVSGVSLHTTDSFPQGIYVMTMEGFDSGRVARGYFKLLAP
ncbi:MAG: S-layer homology domain-containing protein [Chloroflexota bacterium]|nr:S-layer homology domain-containing protein [Chloroflexota bacterium]MDQ5865799.1 S-layer homology domain-containing protein [Chloroflexota bacterium]